MSSSPHTAGFAEAVGSDDVAAVETALRDDPSLARQPLPTGESLLLGAAYRRASGVLELLQRGAKDVPALSPDLFEAAALGRADRLRELIAADGDGLEGHSSDGWTALHLAAHFGHAECVQLLLDAGASTASRSQSGLGNTPLHAALAGGDRTVIDLLVESGADVNATDAAGFTPLHQAAQLGDAPLVQKLLDVGSRPTPANDGRTPLDFANESGSGAAIAALEAADGAS